MTWKEFVEIVEKKAKEQNIDLEESEIEFVDVASLDENIQVKWHRKNSEKKLMVWIT